MPRNTLARRSFGRMMARTSAEGGGGGAGDTAQGGDGGGGQGQGQQQTTEKKPPEEARDEHGAGLGFPKDTRTEDMTDQQKANYWRNQSKVQQRKAEEAERKLQEKNAQKDQGSGTVREQQQGSAGEQVDSTAIRNEAAQDAALATIRSSLALRGKKAEDIDELVDVLSMTKFVTAEHKVDTAKVVAFVEKNAPLTGGSNDRTDFGAGRRENGQPDRAAAGKAAAEKRFGKSNDAANRGVLGGLRK